MYLKDFLFKNLIYYNKVNNYISLLEMLYSLNLNFEFYYHSHPPNKNTQSLIKYDQQLMTSKLII